MQHDACDCLVQLSVSKPMASATLCREFDDRTGLYIDMCDASVLLSHVSGLSVCTD